MPFAGQVVRAGDILTRRGVRARRVAAQSVPNSGTTSISWDTEDDDTDGYITVSSTTVTIPAGLGGIYAVTFFADPATAPATRFICQIVATSTITGMPAAFRSEGAGEDLLSVSAAIPLEAGDTFLCQVFQTSGAAINFTGWLSCYRVGV